MDENDPPQDLSETRFGTIPIDVAVCVGTARPLIKDLLLMERDSILPLDRAVDDPVELYVGDRLLARGSLEEVDTPGSGKLGVRITEILGSPMDNT